MKKKNKAAKPKKVSKTRSMYAETAKVGMGLTGKKK